MRSKQKTTSKTSKSTISPSNPNANTPQKTTQTTTNYTFSYVTQSLTHDITETPTVISTPISTPNSDISVPIAIFSQHASAMQAISRYLVDTKGLSYTQVAKILGRSPKSIWASYHQTKPLLTVDEELLRIPISIFASTKSPLESLVSHLKTIGLRNIEIARTLKLDPRTVWTAAKRAEVRA